MLLREFEGQVLENMREQRVSQRHGQGKAASSIRHRSVRATSCTSCRTPWDKLRRPRICSFLLASMNSQPRYQIQKLSYFGASEATISSKRGSPRNGSQNGSSFNLP